MQHFGKAALRSCWRVKLTIAMLMVSPAILPVLAQSNRSVMLLAGGAWHLHSRIPLGSDAMRLEPSHRVIHMLATAEAPEFEGWSLVERQQKPALIDASGRNVRALPRSITFRISAGTRYKFLDTDPLPLECAKALNDFLLDLHFRVQVFRGMEMHEVAPSRAWLIGIPADEPSEERVYRASFKLGDIHPDDRIVLLVTDSAGTRLTKFHLEFL